MRVRTVGGDPCRRAPPPKKVHWRNSAFGVPATPTQTLDKKNRSRQGGDQPSALEGLPGSHSSQGGRDHPGPASARSRGGPSSTTCAAANTTKKGKNKNNQGESTQTPLPPRVQERGLRGGERAQAPRSSERIQNSKTRRAQNRTPRKRQKRRDARPEWAITQTRRGQKKEKQTDQQTRAGGSVVSC